MATTRIMPLHIGKGRTESRAISDIIDYVANPQKTDNGKLITGYGCDSRTADAEFLLAKRQYAPLFLKICCRLKHCRRPENKWNFITFALHTKMNQKHFTFVNVKSLQIVS